MDKSKVPRFYGPC